MAGIGLYGVYYAKASISDGALTGYTGGIKTMGKAISASFEPAAANENPLYANNGIAEKDAAGGGGGTLTLTLDRLTEDAYADLYGLTVKAATVLTSVGGSGFDYGGDEIGNDVGVAFVKWNQENNSRAVYQAVIFSRVLFNAPSDSYQTLGESVEWQTPEFSGTVSGGAATGSLPWKKAYTFPTQEACIAFITNYFSA